MTQLNFTTIDGNIKIKHTTNALDGHDISSLVFDLTKTPLDTGKRYLLVLQSGDMLDSSGMSYDLSEVKVIKFNT